MTDDEAALQEKRAERLRREIRVLWLLGLIGLMIATLQWLTPRLSLTTTRTPTQTITLFAPSTPTSTPSPQPVSDSVYYMIVLDASVNMQESFDGQSKWDAALESIDAIIDGLSSNANYGLVVVGGSITSGTLDPCGEPSTPMTPFTSKENVQVEINQLKPEGGGSFYAAFNLARIQLEGLPANTIKTMILITGSSDTCDSRDEWRDLERVVQLASPTNLYSEIIILDEDSGLETQSIAERINRLSRDVNMQAPQTVFQLVQTNNTVINNVSNYVDITISSFPTSISPAFTPISTSTPIVGVTNLPPPTRIPPTQIPPTPIPSTPIPQPSSTPTPSVPPAPFVSLDFHGEYVPSGETCIAKIIVKVTNGPVTGVFHVWNASYPPDGDAYDPINFVGDNVYWVGLGGNQPEYYRHEIWFEYNGTSSNRLTNLICPDLLSEPSTPTLTANRLPTTDATIVGSSNIPASLQAVFEQIDPQLRESMKANIAFNTPEEMERDETFTIELLLNPSSSTTDLITQIVESIDLPTATAGPSILITDQAGFLVTSTPKPGNPVTGRGADVDIITHEVEITNFMKAVLTSSDPDAFSIQLLHDKPEQAISLVETTKWRWSITAKKEGTKTLELVLQRLVILDDIDYWREVESYRADIIVKVTPAQRVRDWDWQWVIGIAVTLLLIPAFWRWFDKRSKRVDSAEAPASKYAPLKKYFAHLPKTQQEITFTFAEIEEILKDKLPASARRYKGWWANELRGRHVQASAWLDAGWKVKSVDLTSRRVNFVRT